MSERVGDGEDAAPAKGLWGGLGTGIDCREAVHQLYHYLDGELTDDHRRQIAEHLDFCKACSGAAEFEAELRHVIADKCRDHVPDGLRRRIAEAIEGENHHHAGSA